MERLTVQAARRKGGKREEEMRKAREVERGGKERGGG